MVDYGKLIISLGLCLGIGFIGSTFTSSSIDSWYVSLIKPSFSPPNYIFAPVWIVLYVLAGISLYLIWTSKKPESKAFIVFGINLGLNLLWSYLFFGLRSPTLAFYDVVLLWVSIVATIYFFMKSDSRTLILLLPYLIWVTIASYLNYQIMILNP